jgi:WD40 repeat protein
MSKINRRMSISGVSKKKFVASKNPKCIVIHSENSVGLLKYNETTKIYFDEVRSSALGNKNITCYEFLYTQPVIALGGSDGNIRFWNYSKKKVTQDKVDVHTKSVVKIVVIHVCFILFLLKKLQRGSIISSKPSMLSFSVDGSISCYNLENKVSEFKILKAHGKGNPSIIDMIYDPNSETITTIGSDKSVYIRESKSGNVISNYKISEKVQLKSISMIKTCNYIPVWYILTGNTTK